MVSEKGNMNIWVEYWKKENNQKIDTLYYAQRKEHVKWTPPDPKKIQIRYFSNIESAMAYCTLLNNQGYYTTIKQDGYKNN